MPKLFDTEMTRRVLERDSITQLGTEFIEVEATQVVTRQIPSEFTRRQADIITSQLPISPNRDEATLPVTNEKQVLVVGGCGIFNSKSCEIFNWSTRKWTLYEDMIFFDHGNGFSCVYNNKVMICGGTSTDRVEYVDTTCFGSACAVPLRLPSKDCSKGVLFEDKILTFGQHVSATSLKTPFKTTYPYMYNGRKLSSYGVAYINENAVVIVGGYVVEEQFFNVTRWLTDKVRLYNPTMKSMTSVAPLPYELCDMAVVVYKDNLIILGGSSDGQNSRNNVLMYNITTQVCHMLPKMLQKRYDVFPLLF